MSQQFPGGFPNVQRLQQFAGNQYGPGPMVAPFQGGGPRPPQLSGMYAPQQAPQMNVPHPGIPAAWTNAQLARAQSPIMSSRPAVTPTTFSGPLGPGGRGFTPQPVNAPSAQPLMPRPAAPPTTFTAPSGGPFQQPGPPVVSQAQPAMPRPVPTAGAPLGFAPAPPPVAAPAYVPTFQAQPAPMPPATPTIAARPSVGSFQLSDRREKRILSLREILGT